MSFISIEFFLFVSSLLIVFYILPVRYYSTVMLVASLLFYGLVSPENIYLLFIVIICGFWSALLIRKHKAKAYLILVLSIFVHIGLIFGFKYGMPLYSPESNNEIIYTLIPLGLSFFSLQSLGYVFDVYRGKIQPETKFSYYTLYISFFPQLIVGPIERASRLMPQLNNISKLKSENIMFGSYLIFLGVFKKTVISNNLNVYRQFLLGGLNTAGSLDVLLYPIVTLFWVLFDFSAYTDIARGVAKIFGVSLVENFKMPARATSFRGFWSNWHISLTKWLADYVYIPLALKSKSFVWRMSCTLLVFSLMGLWHAQTFIFFFILNGCLVILEGFIHKAYKKRKTAFNAFLSFLITQNWFVLLIICFTVFYFGLPSFEMSHKLMSVFFSFDMELHIIDRVLKFFILGSVFAILLEIATRKAGGNDELITVVLKNSTLSWLYPVIMFYAIILFGEFGYPDFFYYGF